MKKMTGKLAKETVRATHLVHSNKPLKRSTKPIKRTAVRKKRPGTRRGQATPEETAEIRQQAYDRAGGRCELNLVPECIKGVLPFVGDVLYRAHLVHIGAKRRHGTSLANSKIGCYPCHIVGIHQQGGKGKIVPKKER